MRPLHVLTTGGTIDKVYDVRGTLEVGPPAFSELIAPVLTDLVFDVTPVLGVDSLDMTDDDRVQLLEALERIEEELVLITHGTDTMVETARYLQERLSPAAATKVVVMTGAMRPASLASSDASYNLGAAVAAVQLLEPGVHIAMSGRVFPHARTAKDLARGVFVDAASADLERILRWERQGGEWEVLTTASGAVTVALLRCDGGEEVDRLTSAEPDVRDHVERA